ncbi:cupin domain-containing protein [Streptomyces sp. NPDC090022]|uniref:cupin domain-containing protein n=1 Tax=Streptomyces sp. NPDC090022 TaxID=3365920 RepID=UPI0037FC3435
MGLVVREVVIEPGGSTGWHYHVCEIAAVVKSGTLTRILRDRSVEVTSAGGAFIEPAGIRHAHIGRNLGTEPVVIEVRYDLPEDRPFAVEVPAPPAPPDIRRQPRAPIACSVKFPAVRKPRRR